MQSENSDHYHSAYLSPLGWGQREWRLPRYGAKSEPEMPGTDAFTTTLADWMSN